MITSFKIANFRSIVDLELDLRYGEKRAPNGYLQMDSRPFLEDAETKARVVPCAALFGANAVGKSNIIKALALLQKIIRFNDIDIRLAYNGNRLITNKNATEFELEFVDNGEVYRYSLHYGEKGIISEGLTVNGKESYFIDEDSRFFRGLNTENYSKVKIADIIRVECRDKDGILIRPLLNRLGAGYSGLNDDVTKAYEYITNGIDIIANYSTMKLFPSAVEALSKRMSCPETRATSFIVEFLNKLDLSIADIKLTRFDAPDQNEPLGAFFKKKSSNEYFTVHTIHKNQDGEPIIFRFLEEESEGTQRLATILGYMLASLVAGNSLFIDELDLGLHPILVREVLRLFKSPKLNPFNAHLVFTTHMTDLLDDNVLRMSEIYFLQRDNLRETSVKRLVELRDEGEKVRNVTNFRKQYLEGVYNAIPEPRL